MSSLVTGANGTVGGQVVGAVGGRHRQSRALGRDRARADGSAPVEIAGGKVRPGRAGIDRAGIDQAVIA